MPFCASCHIEHPRTSFSKAQLRKSEGIKKCQNCIEFQINAFTESRSPQHPRLQQQQQNSSRNRTRARNSQHQHQHVNFANNPLAMDQAIAAAYFAVANESALIDAAEQRNGARNNTNGNDDDDGVENNNNTSPTFQPSSPHSPFENRFNTNRDDNAKWPWPKNKNKNQNKNQNKTSPAASSSSSKEEESNNVIKDEDDSTSTNKNSNNNGENTSKNDDDDLHHLDRECPVCMEDFYWNFDSHNNNHQKQNQQHQQQQQHPQTPKILPCSHMCCLTCVTRIITAVRTINHERRVAEINEGIQAARNSGRILRRSQVVATNQNGASSSSPFNDEKDKKPACPICRRDFLVAADIPIQVKQKMERILSSSASDEKKTTSTTTPKSEKFSFQDLQLTLHIASIGNDVPGMIMNMNPTRRCGSVALCETGKCVLFFWTWEDDEYYSHPTLQLGNRVVCNVLEQQKPKDDNNNISKVKKLLLGELVAENVRSLEDYELELENARRKEEEEEAENDDDDEEDDYFADERRREFTREITMFDGDGGEENQNRNNNHSNSNQNQQQRMTDYYFHPQTGRRVYSHDDFGAYDNENEEEEEYYDEDDDDANYYSEAQAREDYYTEQFDNRYSGF